MCIPHSFTFLQASSECQLHSEVVLAYHITNLPFPILLSCFIFFFLWLLSLYYILYVDLLIVVFIYCYCLSHFTSVRAIWGPRFLSFLSSAPMLECLAHSWCSIKTKSLNLMNYLATIGYILKCYLVIF